MNEKRILTVMVKNNSGVLARVASLFGRRGYNIESLTVSATNNPHISRMTVVVFGDDDIIEQIVHQTQKLEEALCVYVLPETGALYRELLLIKLKADEVNRSSIREVCDIYRASIVDLSVSSMIVELTGTPQKLDAFMDVINKYDILEMCRTGVTALERGETSK